MKVCNWKHSSSYRSAKVVQNRKETFCSEKICLPQLDIFGDASLRTVWLLPVVGDEVDVLFTRLSSPGGQLSV